MWVEIKNLQFCKLLSTFSIEALKQSDPLVHTGQDTGTIAVTGALCNVFHQGRYKYTFLSQSQDSNQQHQPCWLHTEIFGILRGGEIIHKQVLGNKPLLHTMLENCDLTSSVSYTNGHLPWDTSTPNSPCLHFLTVHIFTQMLPKVCKSPSTTRPSRLAESRNRRPLFLKNYLQTY